MATMTYTFQELYNQVSKFLGTYGDTGPSGTDLTDAKALVKTGYLNFLTAYDWTFRRKYETLTTETGKFVYELPEDFGGLRTPFIFDNASGYPAPKEASEAHLMELRSFGEHNSYPYNFSFRTGRYDPQTGQRSEVLFWPTPDSEYTLYYSYHTMPPMMVNDTDVPLCGAEMAECLKQFCLAAAEREQDEASGVQNEAMNSLLQRAIQMDKLREPRSVGCSGTLSAFSVARGPTRLNDVIGYSDATG